MTSLTVSRIIVVYDGTLVQDRMTTTATRVFSSQINSEESV
jgi:hypothetical protein